MTQILLLAPAVAPAEGTFALADALRRRGHSVDLLAPHRAGASADALALQDGAVPLALPSAPRSLPRLHDAQLRRRVRAALAAARLPRPDVVVVSALDESLIAARHLAVLHDLSLVLALDRAPGEPGPGRAEEQLAQSVHTADVVSAADPAHATALRTRFVLPSVEVHAVAGQSIRGDAGAGAIEDARAAALEPLLVQAQERAKASRIVFHAPYPLDPAPKSASRQRPNQMLAAFTGLGHRVHRLTGLPFQRSLALADLRRRIAAGQEIEFLYSENSTQPNLLATSLRAGIAPLLEARILALCARAGIPVGQFYRDVYWRFEESQASVPLPRRLLMQAAYRADLAVLRLSTAHMFLPSLPMAPIVPFPEDRVSALPPGAPVHDSPSPGGLSLLYVGGIGPGYALDEGLRALQEVPEATLTMVVREAEWEMHRERYAPLLSDRVRIVHAGSDELQELYDAASACLLLVAPDGYRRFAVPLKLFEYLGYGKPVLASRGTLAGDMVDEMGAGFTVENDHREITALLRRLAADPALLDGAAQRAREAGRKNTWRERARTVSTVLTGSALTGTAVTGSAVTGRQDA